MDDIELEITPTGRIRTIYTDEKMAFLQAMAPHWQIKRASNVEWEQVGEEKGWTVRAAHNPKLAIRIVIHAGRFAQVVTDADDRNAPPAVFVTREAALEAEKRFFWELLPKEPKEVEGAQHLVTHLTQREFDELLEYSTTLPTGTTIGKKWKRRVPPSGSNPTWFLGEYVEDVEPYKSQGMVGIKWTRIEIKD